MATISAKTSVWAELPTVVYASKPYVTVHCCAKFLVVFPPFIILAGIFNTVFGRMRAITSLPESSLSASGQMYAGIALLVLGVIGLILGIWCNSCFENTSDEAQSVVWSGTTTNHMAPVTNIPPLVIQQPVSNSGMVTYYHQPSQQPTQFGPI